MAKDYSKKMKESALIQQTEEYMDNEVFGEQQEPEHGRVEQPTEAPVAAPQPTTPQAVQQSQAPAVAHPSEPLVYNEATKGISVKLPYSLYDALDAIKKQTQRTGNRNDRMGIGDLVVLAVKEFVERNRVG